MTTTAEAVGQLSQNVANLVDVATNKVAFFDEKIADANAAVAAAVVTGNSIVTSAQNILNSTSSIAITVAAQSAAAQLASANAQAVNLNNLSSVVRALLIQTDVLAFHIYDTTRDSDGGAWREKIGHTSLSLEALNTATRGSRAQFPSRALFVVRSVATSSEFAIYDLDDPLAPLWRTMRLSPADHTFPRTIFALNGFVYVGNGATNNFGGSGLYVLDLIRDDSFRYHASSTFAGAFSPIASITSATHHWAGNAGFVIPNSQINSVAAHVVAQTPRNPLRCDLPNPTVAIGTSGGATVIRWDGVICNSQSTLVIQNVAFLSDGTLITRTNGGVQSVIHPAVYQTPSWTGINATAQNFGPVGNAVPLRFSRSPSQNSTTMIGAGRRFVAANNAGGGMFFVDRDVTHPGNSVASYKTASYDTGVLFPGSVFASADSTALLSSATAHQPINEDGVTLTGWTPTSSLPNSTITASGGTITLTFNSPDTAAGGLVGFSKQITGLTVGKFYRLFVSNNFGGTIADGRLRIGNDAGTADLTTQIFSAGSYGFFATAATMHVFLGVNITANVTGTATFPAFSITEAIHDCRGLHSTDGGYVFMRPVGSVTRSAVATDAELASYSGFSAANYFEAPFNSNFDFGTGDVAFGPFWVTDDGVSSVQMIAERAHYTGGAYSGARLQLLKSNNIFQFTISDGTNSASVNTFAFAPTAGARYCVMGVKRGSSLEIWMDTVRYTASVGSVGSLNNASATLTIGRRHASNATADAYGGRIGLFRFGNVAPQPSQIRAAFETERLYFQAGAKILLLGSASVNSLAYDSDREIVYAATPVGTNVFNAVNGLRVAYIQSTTSPNKIAFESSFANIIGGTVTAEQTGGPASWGADRRRWSLTEDNVNSQHRVNFGLSTTTAVDWIFAVPVRAGSRTWCWSFTGGGPTQYFNMSTGANGSSSGGATALPSVNLGDGWFLFQYRFTGVGATQPHIGPASGDNVAQYTGNAGAGGAAMQFGKPILIQRTAALTAADYAYALSNSDNHTQVAANDNVFAIRSATGVDLAVPALSQRERATSRRPVAPYDPTVAEHRTFTTDATPTNVCSVPVREGKSYQFTAEVFAIQHGGVSTDRARYVVRGEVWRDPGGDIQVRSTTTTEAEVTSTMDCVAAVTTGATQAFHIRGTGRAATRLAWSVRFTQWTDSGLALAA